MKIIRVFPRRTRATPDDDLAFCGPPDLFAPLAYEWEGFARTVQIGGPAKHMKRLSCVEELTAQ
jgi:hypothetical protein